MAIPSLRAADSPAAAASTNAVADAEWAAILKDAKPPAPPAEWNKKAPTPEEMAAFKKETSVAAEQLADRIKKFAEAHPNHPKIEEARKKEKTFRQQAQTLRGDSGSTVAAAAAASSPPAAGKAKPPEKRVNPEYETKFNAALGRIKAARSSGPAVFLGELDRIGESLAKEFPEEIEPWQMLLEVSKYARHARKLEIFKNLAANGPTPQARDYGAERVRVLDRIGKPAAMAFKSLDGQQIDLVKMRGKVVLLDFWATWCGPCIAVLPTIKSVYAELHDKGFEILGVSADEDCDDLKAFVKKNKMAWPQVCDASLGAQSILREFGIAGYPTMYLVDKKGNIRDMEALEDLEAKVRALLQE